MKVFAVMGCFDYESDQVIVTFNNREEADNYRNFLDFQTKMGACELHFDYYWVQEQTVYNTLKEFEAFQAEQEQLYQAYWYLLVQFLMLLNLFLKIEYFYPS